jgi:6-phosphofructokinase 1
VKGDGEALVRLKNDIATHTGRAGLISEQLRHHPDGPRQRQRHHGQGRHHPRLRALPGIPRKKVREEVIQLLKGLNVRALVVVGGDGSLTGARLLAEESDLRVIGIPERSTTTCSSPTWRWASIRR